MSATLAGRIGELRSGTTYTVETTTATDHLTIPAGVRLVAPEGRQLTLTVDGVHRDVVPGEYRGEVVLSVTESNVVDFSFMNIAYQQHLAQALYLDQDGVVPARSVLAAAPGATYEEGVLADVAIVSQGSLLGGVYAAGGRHVVRGADITLDGDGGDDFTGWGAGVVSAGKGTRLVLEDATIRTHGVIRTAVLADQGSDLVVKNSDLRSSEGVLPDDYVPNPEFGTMKSVPWMLGLDGNCRTTQLLGDHGSATYVNCHLETEKWGVLSNDISSGARLTTINSTVVVTGDSGYGAYALGGATHRHYGTEFRVRDYGMIIDVGGDTVILGASDAASVAAVDEELGLGLTAEESAALAPRPTTVRSDRFGVMLHASVDMEAPVAQVHVRDGASFETGKAVFLVKGVPARITVDGGAGTRLASADGVLLQIIDSDDPGPRLGPDGGLVNSGVYHEKPGDPSPVEGFDVTEGHERDVRVSFTEVTASGDFCNGWFNGTGPQRMGGETGIAPEPEPSGKNLVLDLDRCTLSGVISSTVAKHARPTIGAADWRLIGEVTNTVAPAVNNGVIVSLTETTWTVTGTSHLTGLTLDESSRVVAASGEVRFTVDGVEVPLRPGSYRGAITVSPV
ncbi:hypothetical protein ACFZDK_52910 [Streptomyces sp. NPDC007901]|uniref:hypothetical protein n=1 Tax=Streptomyces sp. NPDC007901 TaxID=3364785 RepID=UPI0036E5D0A9